MAKPRVFCHSESQSGVYHVVSRVVDRQFRFGEAEKEAFVGMMKALARFHQVEVLTFCVMGNHFHVMVRVPERPEGFDLSFDGVVGLWEKAVGEAWLKGMRRQFEIYDQNGSGEAGREAWRQQMLGRMFSLSEFMKALKQRFTSWYNRRNGRAGTLWEGRYKSIIVEDEERALLTMATYIDLNPVRAGLVEDPGDYRWSGYAEAMAGQPEAVEGIAMLTGATPERVYGRGLEAPPVEETAAMRKRRGRKQEVCPLDKEISRSFVPTRFTSSTHGQASRFLLLRKSVRGVSCCFPGGGPAVSVWGCGEGRRESKRTENKRTDLLTRRFLAVSFPPDSPPLPMAKPRVFCHSESQSGVYHVVSRVVDRQFRFGEAEKEAFVGMMKALARFHQVEVLTFCVMGNHFHVMVRVPERPEGFDLSFDGVVGLWEKAVGEAWLTGMRRQFEIYDQNGSGEAGREAWRQQMLGRMFSLSEFMKALKQRFTSWYNRRNGRAGTLWEGRYKSIIVEDEERALLTMATYIDLNPVRAGLVEDPGDYRWSGYAEAMAGQPEAVEGITMLTGATPERVYGRGLEAPPVEETATMRKRRQLRGLIRYRQVLGVAGRLRVREDGKVVRRGVSERVRQKLEAAGCIKREQLMKRVRHFTDGVILGSREFINSWFERNRAWFGGSSSANRKSGARKIAPDWRRVFTLRQLKAPR